MSGHSKWSNIKRKKEVKDSKRGDVFSKMSRAIIVAAKQGGGDPSSNPALRLAIEKAKAARMPKDNIKRAIKKGTGELLGESYEEVFYEAFGPQGVGFIVNVMTDNKNRTISELRNLFTRCGGSLGVIGSAAYMFDNDRNPTFEVDLPGEKDKKRVESIIGELEQRDDVQDFWHNAKL